MNAKETAAVLKVVAANYQTQIKAPEDMQKLWVGMLAEYSYEQVVAAAKVHMTQSEYPPKVSDIIKLIREQVNALPDRKPRFTAAEKRAGVERNRRTYDEIRAGKYRKDGKPVDLDAKARKCEAEMAPRLEAAE